MLKHGIRETVFLQYMKKTKYAGKKFVRFCEEQIDWNFNVIDIPAAAALDKLLDKFFNDVRKQNGGM